jgi:hypothetical protein
MAALAAEWLPRKLHAIGHATGLRSRLVTEDLVFQPTFRPIMNLSTSNDRGKNDWSRKRKYL